ncbi:hypothetical protein LEMLEM_LOCUS15917 [Lemmus lemmus]
MSQETDDACVLSARHLSDTECLLMSLNTQSWSALGAASFIIFLFLRQRLPL